MCLSCPKYFNIIIHQYDDRTEKSKHGAFPKLKTRQSSGRIVKMNFVLLAKPGHDNAP